MEQQNVIGIDIGGTTVKLAFVTYDGEIIHKWEIPTVVEGGPEGMVEDIATSIRNEQRKLDLSHEDFKGIGAGAPGYISLEEGIVYEAVNIGGWKDVPLSKLLGEATGYNVRIENDANLAALGEYWKGAGDKAEDLLAYTLGTGVGGGIIANGELLHGANGTVAELGHMTVIANGGRHCNCGRTGCLETEASATGIARSALDGIEQGRSTSLKEQYDQSGEISARDVFEAAADGDELAKEIIDHVTNVLGLAISNMAIAINPSKIVIGGGVSKAGDQLLEPLRSKFDRFTLQRTGSAVEFVIASLGNDAGVIGAAYLARQ
ncbi:MULTISPECIES: ROK family glucokinase [Pontibacillus]|uniref:Glucokinase n=1 Tax=Pontibacillus chungwhensis TaxID=265426 RepID=A0ABY8UUC0_9BACI|nr:MULTISPECIES: ROK family glucokinase [Pontibacillus]MCD5323566.1 ROK family glucokinase [Pontibacillus sp. HN14]WIF96935.1 ROK family glucokinase [Pontibacillus chungwhensis]